VGSTPTPFGFAGQASYQTDNDTGLKLLGHRYYDSSTGRFISRDPIQDGDNWYAYCANDPINGLDANGQSWISTGIGVAAGLGVIALFGTPLLAAVAVAVAVGAASSYFGEGSNLGEAAADGAAAGTIVGELVPIGIGIVAAANYYGNCFVAGTEVQMSDGHTKPIEQIKPGDKVATKDENDLPERDKDGKEAGVISGKVVRTFVHKHAEILKLQFDNGENITVTKGHPFFVQGKGWTQSGELSIGDNTVTRLGYLAKVVQVTSCGVATVYNFEVEETHTYFVGSIDGGVWVHNLSIGETIEAAEAAGMRPASYQRPPNWEKVRKIAEKAKQPNFSWDEFEAGHPEEQIQVGPVGTDGWRPIYNGQHRILGGLMAGNPVPENLIDDFDLGGGTIPWQ
jgi:RHS repeat-associated protein